MSELKECSKCGKIKSFKEFNKRTNSKDGLMGDCRICHNKRCKKYYKTLRGMIVGIYNSQTFHSKRRNHTLQDYTSEELINHAVEKTNIIEMYTNWVKSGYNSNLKPSFDRLDDYKPYTLDNLQLITWEENNKKGYEDRKNGINNKQSKAVIGVHKGSGDVVEFYSTHEASRQLNICNSNISKSCKGKIKSVGGYIWSYKEPENTAL